MRDGPIARETRVLQGSVRGSVRDNGNGNGLGHGHGYGYGYVYGIPSTPAFWDAVAARRPSVARAAWSIEVAGKSETTLLVRRRPPSEPEEVHRNARPVECPVA